MKRKVEIEVDVPEGMELTGEQRRTKQYGPCELSPTVDGVLLILRKVEPKRESRWMNVYPPNDVNPKAQYHKTMEGAITSQGDRCPLPLLRIDYEDGKPVRVELDPAPPLTQ